MRYAVVRREIFHFKIRSLHNSRASAELEAEAFSTKSHRYIAVCLDQYEQVRAEDGIKIVPKDKNLHPLSHIANVSKIASHAYDTTVMVDRREAVDVAAHMLKEIRFMLRAWGKDGDLEDVFLDAVKESKDMYEDLQGDE
jgi:homoserine dehydrogenase